MNKLKVGLIDPVGGHGGMDYYDYGLGLRLKKNDVLVSFTTCKETKNILPNNFYDINYFFGKIWDYKGFKRLYFFIKGYILSFLHFKKLKIDIIQFQFFHLKIYNLIILFIAKFFGFKICVTMHDVDSLFGIKTSKIFSDIAFKLMDRIFVHNKFHIMSC